jgi:hypothetical protein
MDNYKSGGYKKLGILAYECASRICTALFIPAEPLIDFGVGRSDLKIPWITTQINH